MRLQDIKSIAKGMGIPNVSAARKADLIRAIQKAEGNFDCFGSTEGGVCDQAECVWLSDCLPAGRQEDT